MNASVSGILFYVSGLFPVVFLIYSELTQKIGFHNELEANRKERSMNGFLTTVVFAYFLDRLMKKIDIALK